LLPQNVIERESGVVSFDIASLRLWWTATQGIIWLVV